MNVNVGRWVRRAVAAASAACMAFTLSAVGVAQEAPPAPGASEAKEAATETKDAADETKEATKETAKDAKETAKDATDAAKDTTKDAADTARKTTREGARDATDDARETTRDSRESARETARDTGRATREGARDTRESARDATRDARDTARDTRDSARDAARDGGREAREGARDVRDSARETAREGREAVRETRESNRESREFRADSVRSADIGLWFGRSNDKGLVISDVATSGTIARVGFHEGDRIVSVNGNRIRAENDFVRYLFADDIRNERVKVIVIREGTEEIIYVEPSVLVSEYGHVEHDPLEQFGVVLDDRYDNRIVVWKVVPRSPAYYAGIRSGDIITTFHGQKVSNSRDFVQLVTKVDPGDVAIQVSRGDRMRDLQVSVPRFEAEARTALRPNTEGVERRTERREDRRDERGDERREAVQERPQAQPVPSTQPGRRGPFRRR